MGFEVENYRDYLRCVSAQIAQMQNTVIKDPEDLIILRNHISSLKQMYEDLGHLHVWENI